MSKDKRAAGRKKITKRITKRNTKRKKAAPPSRWGAYLFMLINTLTWGASMIVVKPSLDVTTPFRFLFYRYLLAGILGLPVLWYFRSRFKLTLQKVWHIAGIEALGTGLALWLIYEGLQRTAAIEAGLLTSSQPIFVLIAGVLFFRERAEKHEVFGMGLAFLGTVVLTIVPFFTNGTVFESVAFWGNILILLSMAVNAFYFPLARKYYRGVPKLLASTVSFYVGLVFFGILSLVEADLSLPLLANSIATDVQAPSVVFASFYMAVFGSIIGYTALIKAMDRIEASEAILFNYLQPLVYIPLGIWLLGERVHPLQLAALTVISLGVYFAERRPT